MSASATIKYSPNYYCFSTKISAHRNISLFSLNHALIVFIKLSNLSKLLNFFLSKKRYIILYINPCHVISLQILVVTFCVLLLMSILST